MTTATHIDDLKTIVSNLDLQLAAIDGQVQQHQERLAGLRQELDSIGRNKALYAADLQTAAAHVERLKGEKRLAQRDADLSQSTSLEAQKKQELATIAADLQKWLSARNELQASAEQDSKATDDTGEAIALIVKQLTALNLQRFDLAQTRARFDADHAEHVKTAGLAELAACDREILAAHAALEQLQSARLDAQRQLAQSLMPWSALAEQTLIEHGRYPEAPGAQLLAAKLAMVQVLEDHWSEIGPNAYGLATGDIPIGTIRDCGGIKEYRASQERARVQNGDFIHSNQKMQAFEAHMAAVRKLYQEIQAQNQEIQAQALLRDLGEQTGH